MNPHSTQILGLIVVSVWAIASAKGAKEKLLSLVTIVAFMAAALGIGLLSEVWSGNSAARGNMAINLMILLGVVSAIGCIFKNRRRGNQPFAGR
ncbi:MAG TPA: hypothetical protein VJX47_08510 [Candidatus Sulfotelmatobacter sp.]|nr:hypothetical protein [Candidatus Sulfotelmatobacter sp.]